MSIYNGFATRLQQKKYNHCLQSLLKLLVNRLTHHDHHDQHPDAFFKVSLINLYQHMEHLEVNKYMAPYYSKTIKKLIKQVHHLPKDNRVLKESFYFDEAKLYQKPVRHFIKINNTLQIQKNNGFERQERGKNIFQDNDDFRDLPRKISYDFKRNSRAQSQEQYHFKSLANKVKMNHQMDNGQERPQQSHFVNNKREVELPLNSIESIPQIQKYVDKKDYIELIKTKEKGRGKQKSFQIRSPREFLKNLVLKTDPSIPLGARTRVKHQRMVQD